MEKSKLSSLAVLGFALLFMSCNKEDKILNSAEGGGPGVKEPFSLKMEHSIGDSWTTHENYRGIPDIICTETVRNLAMDYKGQEVIEVTVQDSAVDFVNEHGVDFKDVRGEIRYLLRQTDQYPVYVEIDITSMMRLYEDISPFYLNVKTITTYELEGSVPELLRTGDHWTIVEKQVERTETRFDSILVEEKDTSFVETNDYQVLGVEDVQVSAGTFTGYKILNEVRETSEYSIMYFSPEVGGFIRTIQYEDGQIKGTSDLTSYKIAD